MAETMKQRLEIANLDFPSRDLGLEWKQVTPADGLEIARLIYRCERFDQTLSSVGEDDIADLLEFGAKGGVSDVIVGRGPDEKIRALAVVEVMSPDWEYARANLSAFIDPYFRGRGIGRSLLRWQEDRARQLLIEEFGEDSTLPVRIAGSVEAHMDERRRLYKAAGFSPRRTFEVMYRTFDSTEPEVAMPGEGYAIVPWIPELDTEIHSLHLRAFSDHWGQTADVEEWWNKSRPSMEKRWSFVAISPQGEVAGYIMVCRHPARWIQTGVQRRTQSSWSRSAHAVLDLPALITKAMNAAYASRVRASASTLIRTIRMVPRVSISASTLNLQVNTSSTLTISKVPEHFADFR